MMKVVIDGWAKGSYILLVEMPRVRRIRIGALGEMQFPQGFYAYVGSAMGGLQARLNRHLDRVKRVRWHIDYLLEQGRVKGMIYAPTSERLECQLAQRLEGMFRSLPRFGSSDCHCPSHLFFSEALQALQEGAETAFRDLLRGRDPITETCFVNEWRT